MAPGGETERELERTVQSAQQAQGEKDVSGKEAEPAPAQSDGESRKPDPEAGEGPRISIPEGGVIRSDPKGDGNFGSKRTHGLHEGVDITARPGQLVPAPIDGVVIKKGIVYDDKNNRGLLSTHIKGTGKWTGYTVKMFYVNNTGLKEGTPVKKGATLGPAQDVRVKHGPKMTPHIHYEVYKDGKLIDPTSLLIENK